LNQGATLYVGLMSGTSMDGIDAALVAIDKDEVQLLACHQHPWPAATRQQLQMLASNSDQALDQFGMLDARSGEIFADAVNILLAQHGIPASAITAIGSHGQTVRHGAQAKHSFTLQIGDPNRIAQLTGITTVADFRRRDIAAGGQGAPLVPAFHHACFANAKENRVIVNIGGIANISIVPADANHAVTGFDTGPGNRLLDDWIQLSRNEPFDRAGAWAASGTPNERLVQAWLADAFFAQAPPKSTGSDYFHLDWLGARSPLALDSLPAADVQASLLELTARSIAEAIKGSAPHCNAVYLCGGGAHNLALRTRLQTMLAPRSVQTTAVLGLDPDWVEAAAFAWLAHRCLQRLPGNLPAVTGASAPVILGGIYSA